MCSYKKLKSYQKVNRCFDKELDQAAKLADYRSDFGFSNQLKAISRYIFTGLGSGSLDLNMSKGELIKTPGMVLLKSLADKRLTDLEVLGGRCLTRRPECISSVLKILKNAQLQDINMSCLRAGGGFNLQFLNRAKYITCFDQKAKQHKALSVLPWHRLVAEGNRYPVGKRFLFRIRFASTEVAPNDITVSGPAGLVVGSSGKVVFWDTTAADIGTHRFSVKFTMSGVVHEKSFAMEVYDPLHAAWKDGFPLGPINQNITLRGTCVAKTHLIGSGLAPINKKTWAATYQLTFKGNTPGPLYVADGNYQALKLYPSTRYELRNGSWFVQLKYGEIKGMLYKGQIKVKSGYALDLSKGGKYKKLRGTNCTYTGQLY